MKFIFTGFASSGRFLSRAAAYYFIRKGRKSQGPFPEITDQLRAMTPIYPDLEMSDYG